jgi:hypothetical protein
MTVHDAGGGRDRNDDVVEAVPGVPTDRVRWGPIVAGTFAALTMLAVLSTLGAAVGLSAYDPGDDPRRFAVGSGIWGVLSLIVSFAFGGWLAARASAVKGPNNGLLNGFMVAGFGIPLMLFMIGSMASAAGGAAAANRDAAAGQTGGAVQASARMGDQSVAPGNTPPTEDVRRAASRTAWSTLIGLVLAIGAASAAGYVGASDGGYGTSSRRRMTGDRAGGTTSV